MSIIYSGLPSQIRDNTVIKHLDAPYSDEALAEPYKDLIHLGAVEISHLSGDLATVKSSGMPFECSSLPKPYRALHQRFMNAAALLLTPEALREARVSFAHKVTRLEPGQAPTTTEAHLDDVFPDSHEGRGSYASLRLLGFVASALPSGIYQGALTRDDFLGDPDLKTNVPEEKNLTVEYLPVNRMVLAGPAMPHFAREAKEFIPNRHFLRWQLFV